MSLENTAVWSMEPKACKILLKVHLQRGIVAVYGGIFK